MKLIVLTAEEFLPEEAAVLNAFFGEGLETLHLRKPASGAEEVKRLLDSILPSFLGRIVLHDHFQLTQSYPLKGIHLNRRNPHRPEGYTGSVSRSCHTLEEVRESGAFQYVFLSPIFQSISKEKYGQAFSDAELFRAKDEGILSGRVIALGGINRETLPQAAAYGFGGAAILGTLWKAGNTRKDWIPIFQDLKQECDRL